MNSGLQLRDIHLPAEVSSWPPAYGWWLLAFGLLILLGAWLRRWWQQRPLPVLQVCQPALAELTRLEQTHRDDPTRLVREVSVLLRRSAMSLYGRHGVSGLSGVDWLTFLEQQSGASSQGKPRPAAQAASLPERLWPLLTELPYREYVGDSAAASEVVQLVRAWLAQQHDPTQPRGRRDV